MNVKGKHNKIFSFTEGGGGCSEGHSPTLKILSYFFLLVFNYFKLLEIINFTYFSFQNHLKRKKFSKLNLKSREAYQPFHATPSLPMFDPTSVHLNLSS